MGACDFVVLSHGKTAGEAFARAVTEAQWEHGHGGYTGTIAEKSWFVEVALPSRVMAERVVSALRFAELSGVSELDRTTAGRARREREWLVSKFGESATAEMLRVYSDKWADALVFRVSGKQAARYRLYNEMKRGERVWMFAGWASS